MGMSYKRGAKKVDELKDQLDSRIEDAVEDSMADVSDEMSRQLRLNDSVARRVLVNAIVDAQTTIERPNAIVSHGVYGPSFWKYLEYGTGIRGEGRYDSPIVPPFEKILTWIVEKDIQPYADGIDSQYELASVIQDTIALVGTYSHPFVRPTWRGPRGKEHVRGSVESAMDTAVQRSF
jgi:hypothetical protein